MTEQARDKSEKLINLTQVWPIYARRTLRDLWNGEPGRFMGKKIQPITLHVDNINLMRPAPPDIAGTEISTRFNGTIFVEETSEEIRQLVSGAPKP